MERRVWGSELTGWVMRQGLRECLGQGNAPPLGGMGLWTPQEGSHSREQDRATPDGAGGAPTPQQARGVVGGGDSSGVHLADLMRGTEGGVGPPRTD